MKHYLMFPKHKNHGMNLDKEIYKNIHDSHIYISHLNDKITELTVTVLSSKVISDNIQLFHPILKSIQKLNINLDSGSVQNIPELLNLIYFCVDCARILLMNS